MMLDKAKEVEDFIIKIRRQIHENPELSGEEYETQATILSELEKLDLEIEKVGNTSIIARLVGEKPGKTVALRADMDALPIIEQADIDFKSKNQGVMHACGHDAHASMLLGAAKILSTMKKDIKGEIRFFFQEGEENFSGAKKIIAAGGMEGVDGCFGMHGLPGMDAGYAHIESGYVLTGCDTIFVKFEGVSGHGSAPHLAKDTIHPACMFVTDIQSIVTKNVDPQEPIVVTVGKFNGGTKPNIISKFTDIEMSMRYFDPEARKTVHEAIIRHAKAIADAYEISVDVQIEESTLSLRNDEDMTELAEKTCEKVMGQGKNVPMKRIMASEDMSYYMQHAKGVYINMGYRNVDKGAVYFPHHEKFKIDEDYMKYGAAMFAQFALDFLDSDL
ncbi:M20 metallopeptidase family protein [Peptostreptococcus equinus]|uniref:Amidohydrolase n=1 Tax=Peptostreptococcus equinus TaxID=3003601 RepID=A0ABY7JN66_9FIRM|nr:amidohydrolase [Peptostreptococcus sp. CBA3647]WAW14540.1 amidohydrolase [Peptostreptococcus sp. CBA3647]